MIITILSILLIYAITITLIAFRLRDQRNDYRLANEIRKQSIDDTREGKPPFLLDPGVKITVEEEQ